MNRTRSNAVLASITLAVVLALVGCAPGATTEEAAPAGACAGVQVIVEFGDLGGSTVDECVETDAAMTALDAFTAAGVEIAPSEAYGDAIVCRVDGLPAADTELSTASNGPYTETCAEFGPIWASWSLWVDFGSGWELGQEAVNTQRVEPGQRVSLTWQQGDYTDMVEWLAPAA